LYALELILLQIELHSFILRSELCFHFLIGRDINSATATTLLRTCHIPINGHPSCRWL